MLFSEKSSGVTSGEMACCEPTERLAALMPALMATSKLIPRVRQDITPPAKLREGGRREEGRKGGRWVEEGGKRKGERERGREGGREGGKAGGRCVSKERKAGKSEKKGERREASSKWKGGTKGGIVCLLIQSLPLIVCVHTLTPLYSQTGLVTIEHGQFPGGLGWSGKHMSHRKEVQAVYMR